MRKWFLVIIDDQQSAIDHLLGLLAGVAYVEVVGTFTDEGKARRFLQFHKVDFLIVDVELATMNAFRFIAGLANPRIPTILYTAHAQYEDEGYERAFVDVLLKPVSESRLLGALRRVDSELRALLPATENELESYYEYFQVKGPVRFRRQMVWLKDLVYADMQDGKLHIHLQDGSVLETNTTFKRFTEVLPPKWFKVCALSVVLNINFYKGMADKAVVLTALTEDGQHNLTLPAGAKEAYPDFYAFVNSNLI